MLFFGFNKFFPAKWEFICQFEWVILPYRNWYVSMGGVSCHMETGMSVRVEYPAKWKLICQLNWLSIFILRWVGTLLLVA